MLYQSDFTPWCLSRSLPQPSRSLLNRIRTSPPTRCFSSRNVTGRCPSRKIGVTIQFESNRGELATIYDLGHRDDVLEYYDQAPAFKLNYIVRNQRPVGVIHAPDFFVIRQTSAGWEECKPKEELIRLSELTPMLP